MVDLNIVKENVRKLQQGGATREQLDLYLRSVSGGGETPQTEPFAVANPSGPAPQSPSSIAAPVIRQPPPAAAWAEPARDILASFIRPGIEAGASAAMSALAPAATGTVATGGMMTPLLAAVAAGALGFSAAKTGLDWIDAQLHRVATNAPPMEAETPGTVTNGIVTGLNNYREGLLWELLGRGTGAAVGKLASALTVKPKTPIEEIAEELHIRLSPAEATQRRSTQLLETVLEKAPTSTNIMADFRFQEQLKPLMEERARLLGNTETTDQQLRDIGFKVYSTVNRYLQETERLRGEQLEQVRAGVLAQLGGTASYDSIGVRGKEALKVAEEATRIRATELYTAIGNNFNVGENITTPELNKKASELLTERLKLPSQDSSFLKRLRWAATAAPDEKDRVVALLEQQYAKVGKPVPPELLAKLKAEAPLDPSTIKDWHTLVAFEQELRSLIDEGDALKGAGGGGVVTNIKQLDDLRRMYVGLRAAVQIDMENAATKAGPYVWSQYNTAKTFYRENISELYRSKQIRNIVKSSPKDVLDAVFVTNGDREIRLLKKALSNVPEEEKAALVDITGKKVDEYQSLLEGFTNKLLGVGHEEAFNPKLLRNNIRKYGEAMLIEAYGLPGYSSLRRASESGTQILLAEPVGATYLRAITKPDVIDMGHVVDDIIGAVKHPTAPKALTENLSLLRNILDPDTFRQLSHTYLERLFTPELATGQLDPIKLSQTLAENKKVLQLWYPRETYNRLMNIAEVGVRLKSASKLARGAGEGETLAAWTTAGVVVRSIAGAGIVAGGAMAPTTTAIMAPTVLLAPRLLAKLVTSEHGLRFLDEAMHTRLTVGKAAELSTKLLTAAYGTGPLSLGITGSVPTLKRERIKREYQQNVQ